MGKSLEKLAKLRGRSFDELRSRGAQMLAVYAERSGLSPLARVPSDAALLKELGVTNGRGPAPDSIERLLEGFRRRTSPRFFAAFDDPEGTRAELRRRFRQDYEAGALDAARGITQGYFDLLGLRSLHFGSSVDWHLEPVSGLCAPLAHWSQIDFLDAAVAGDKKVTWELNRHQYFATLGRAYWYTGDERYARTFAEHVASWMDRNPPKLGINWASSLEVSYRAISWLWALHFFKDSPHLTPPLFARLLKLLFLQARHLETYLSVYFSPNTHLTGEALGLFYLGTLLPKFRRAERWRATGRAILRAELDRHIRPDGVYFEQTSYYHHYTADIYTHFLLLSRANDEPVPDELIEKLTALQDHLMYITCPDGRTPLFGDDDGGRLVMLDSRRADDFRASLATAAAVFARPDYKHVAGEAAEESLWLLGPPGLEAYDRLESRPPAGGSRAFPDGGYYVMRDGWTRAANYFLIDCGPHGALNCAHAHADALSFVLSARGRTLLVDPGTYTYTGSAEARDYFRGSAAHNTLTVDGESSSVPGGPFSWRSSARAAARVWISHTRFDFFEGEHDGYRRLASPVGHARGVLFLKGDYWVVRDRVDSSGPHRFQLNFHFAAGTQPQIVSDGGVTATRERRAGEPGLEMFVFGEGGEWRREGGWVSSCYGDRAASTRLVFSAGGDGPVEFVTFLIPRRAGEGEARVRELEAAGGRAFEVSAGATRDVVLVGGTGRPVEASGLASDFDWAWARERGGEFEDLVAVGGRSLSLGGREVIGGGRVAYAVARREGGGWGVEAVPDGANAQPPAPAERPGPQAREFG